MAVFGYARVSTRDQNMDFQNAALKSAGAHRIVTEVASGKSMDRPQLQKLLIGLEAGDVLLIWKLDRLGRSLSGVLSTLEALAARGVAYRSLSEPMIDSTKDDHLSRALVGVLAVFAQLERDIIRERVREGVAIAKAQGKMQGRGRPKALGALDESALLAEAACGERTVSDLCRRFRISRTTYYRLAGAYEGRESVSGVPESQQCHFGPVSRGRPSEVLLHQCDDAFLMAGTRALLSVARVPALRRGPSDQRKSHAQKSTRSSVVCQPEVYPNLTSGMRSRSASD